MEKKKVICYECGKFLFESEKDSWGAVGAEALHKGYIYKVPILYRSIKAERLFLFAIKRVTTHISVSILRKRNATR